MKFNSALLHKDFVLIRREREKQEDRVITLREIAKKCGIDRVCLHRTLNGITSPELQTISGICKYLGKDISDYIVD